MNKESQCKKVLRHLESNRSITQLEALHLYGIGRLAARIADLEEKEYCFLHKPVMIEKADGTKARVMSYELIQNEMVR